MNPDELKTLLRKYEKGRCTADEHDIVDGLLDNMSDKAGQEIIDWRLWKRVNPGRKERIYLVIVTTIIGLIGIAVAISYFRYRPMINRKIAAYSTVPGRKAVLLKLPGGRTVNLSAINMGDYIEDEGVMVCKNGNGQIAYAYKGNTTDRVRMHRIVIPNGGRFNVLLPDGTSVMINSGSTITYPTHFTGPERRVDLVGEAYFEVAKDALHPFVITSNGQQVKVLGTEFNIHAYPEAAMVTTLVKGSIELYTKGDKPKRLKPGEESVLYGALFAVRKANVRSAIAWKEGEFLFQSARLSDILPQLEHWYDVEFVYDDLPDDNFTLATERSAPLSKILSLLEYSSEKQLKFTMEGRKIIIK
ncbi:FecR domain-containing protein [Chitinophaga pendula]|uniref:FecR family protein n=1 Tax=Chitinophaga TaxID=79328 RepID=UPI000BAEA927|nr:MULTISPECIES: FecR family protein [Chitinophaga]ASZ13897.1 hypothetical protein CK934_24530 [Chitinophaga sp. MD30]UCJ08483.1 FecR domain-containing protein [Chitinophaga pendula]